MKFRNLSVKLDKKAKIVGTADEGTGDEKKITAKIAWTVGRDEVLLKKVFVSARYDEGVQGEPGYHNVVFEKQMKVENVGIQTTFKG